jgi:uncharacterized membrane protein
MAGEGTAVPGAREWRAFLDRLLLWAGATALAVAVVFFIAYNWQYFGRLSRFGAAELLVLGAVLAYWRLGEDRAAGKAALLAAAILVGALLALFGQTYQTGADTWELFAYWAALIVPWALVGRFAALWILCIGLVNVAIALYLDAFPRGTLGIFQTQEEQFWSALLFNAAALALLEAAARRWSWLDERWAPRLVAVAAGLAATFLALRAIVDWRAADGGGAAALAYLAWSAALFGAYRWLQRDVFMLAGMCLSLIVVVAVFLGRVLLDSAGGAEGFAFLFIAVAVVAMAGASGWWLRQVAKGTAA